jgi:hypothetical protein
VEESPEMSGTAAYGRNGLGRRRTSVRVRIRTLRPPAVMTDGTHASE